MDKTVHFDMKMTEEEKSLAKRDAHRHEMNLSEYIRWLLEEERRTENERN